MGEWRRMRAWHLRRELGLSQRDIALVLEVSEAAVSKWLRAARSGGVAALRPHPHPGRRAKLTSAQRRLIPDFLWHGAEAYGFRGEVWTGRRVRRVLAQEFGVWYSHSQVCRLLKAIQADPVVIGHWREEVWPEVRERARQERRILVFIDESGFYLLPEVVRTYAPKGARPLLREWQTRDHLSVMGALTPQGGIYSLVRQEPLTGLETVAFLGHLQRLIGERLLVVWDNSPIHRRQEVKAFLAQGAARNLHIEPLPPYAPELNPVEWLWGHCKAVELGNVVCLDLEQLHLEFHLALGRLRQKPHLIPAFFAGAGLML